MAKLHDVAILGATPSGFAAACYLAGKGLEAVVVDAPTQASESPLADWVPGHLFKLSGLPKSLLRASGAARFQRVVFHNAAMSQSAEYRSRGVAGYLLHASELTKAFRAAAGKAGVRVRSSKTPPAIELGEDAVRLVGTTQVRAKLLLIAHSRPNEVLSDLALPSRAVVGTPLTVAGLDLPVGARKTSQKVAGALHVIETGEQSDLGLFFVAGSVVHLRMISGSRASGTRAEELSTMLAGLQRAGILPTDLPLARAKGAVWHPPAGGALELESHVAKRCLLAGTAGGFADSITGQTLAPSVKSALLAAEVAAAALSSRQPQATLMRFKTSWREALADALRPPNTALQMLLPLLFVNRKIITRFTRALLYGEPI